MKITKEWLIKKQACEEGLVWFLAQQETDCRKVVEKLITENHLEWANWLICRLFKRKQKIQYAIFAAESCLANFEKQHPEDKRPRLAIEAATTYLKNPTKENKSAARSAAWSAAWSAESAVSAASAAWSAASAASAAWSAASAARSAAWSAAWSAESAASAAWIARNAAWSVAWSAEKLKILRHGLNILESK